MGTRAHGDEGAWGRGRRASWCEVAARPAVASAKMARAEDMRAVGMAAAGLATAATVPVSMVAASQRWQGRRWRRWCWRERRQREESRCPAWPHPRQPSPRHPSALGTRRHPTRRQKRPPSRHRRPVPPTSGWRCGHRAWQGAAKSGPTPRVGRLPPADTGHPLGPCGRLRTAERREAAREQLCFTTRSPASSAGDRSLWQPRVRRDQASRPVPVGKVGWVLGKGNAPVAPRYNDYRAR